MCHWSTGGRSYQFNTDTTAASHWAQSWVRSARLSSSRRPFEGLHHSLGLQNDPFRRFIHEYAYALLVLSWSVWHVQFPAVNNLHCWSRWLFGLRRRSAAPRLQGSPFRIPLRACSSSPLYVVCFIGSGLVDELITRSEEPPPGPYV
jgi:hypothetical protein